MNKTKSQKYNDNMQDIWDKAFYLDYFNNYLTIARISEDYNIFEWQAIERIARGKKLINK